MIVTYKELIAFYNDRVCTVLIPELGSHPLSWWKKYFKEHPELKNKKVKKKLKYARETKVEVK